jgi:hypothetical protein
MFSMPGIPFHSAGGLIPSGDQSYKPAGSAPSTFIFGASDYFSARQSANDSAVKKPRNPPNPYAHILPFPVGPIMLAPSMITAEGGIYRSALVLCLAYWISGCRPLPRDTASLCALARVPAGNLVPKRSKLDAVLSELLPILSAEYDYAFKNKAHKSAICKLASDSAVAKRRSGKSDGKSFTAPSGPARIAPVKAPSYRGSGRTDMQARRDAIERDKPPTPVPGAIARVRVQGLLSDSASVARK